jgi:hypothetical protein
MRAWSTLAFLLVAACSFGSSDVEMIDNWCANDASCPQGVCDGNICIDDSGASVEVAIEVLRGESDPQRLMPASWAFVPESFSGPSARDLVLPATRQVRGVVRWDGLSVPATLRFVRRMAGAVAPLTPLAIEVDTLRETTGGDGPEGYDYNTVLVAGETYDVLVLPTSDMVTTPMEAAVPAIRSLPPLYLELAVDENDPSEPFRFDVAFPADLSGACADNLDVGCTLEADVLSVDDEAERAEAGLQVRAIDKETGLVVSSIAETDENGHFAIRIGNTTSGYLIRVTSGVGRDPFPAVSVDPDVAFAGDPMNKLIYIPRLSPVQFSGEVRDMLERPVPGATVRFLSTSIFGENLLGLEGAFSGSATTNEDGSFGTELLPGLYSITVTPPEDVENTWGILSTEALVGEEITTTDTLIVPSQVGLRGWVRTFRDESASGVTILARARSNIAAIATHRSQEAVSNTVGAFLMSVDSGLYDMHVKVSSETGFGWLVEPELVMSSERGDLARTYELLPPIPIGGTLQTNDGVALPGALIRAYVLTGTGPTRPIQVGETVTDEDGSYRLLIAPRLADE